MRPEESGKLFETPAGIRIIDAMGRSCESTVDMAWTDDGLVGSDGLFEGFDPEARVSRIRDGSNTPVDAPPVIRRTKRQRVPIFTRGARFVYALIALCLCAGTLGLAMVTSMESLLWVATTGSILCAIWFVASLFVWLDRSPYFYRLLTSLGENADNLAKLTMVRWVRQSVKSLYS